MTQYRTHPSCESHYSKQMKHVLKIIIAIHLSTFAGVLIAQDCAPIGPPFTPRPLGANCRMFGEIKVDSFQTPELTSASMEAHLLGKTDDVVSVAENAGIRVLNDVLIMRLAFFAPRNVTPQSAYLELTSYSPIRSKHEHDNKLTIYINGSLLISKKMEMRSSIGIGEIFWLEIPYSDFLKVTNARKATIQFGETNIELNSEAIEALNNLNITARGLKNPPSSWT